tara:strand:+ start:173 stop:478 length:306 start_codon:yes stop_codon:yes gene_type:complete
MNSKKTPFTSTASIGTSTTGLSFNTGNTNDYYDRLLLQIEKQQRVIKNLEQQLKEKNSEVNLDLTKDDIKFILMKCHPDKNMNSKQAAKVTAKLLKLRESK